jgi:hypothetical protein
MQFERAWQTRPRATGGVAADAGIHYAVSVTLRSKALLQQRHPSRVDCDAVAGAQTVAHDQDDGFRRTRVN